MVIIINRLERVLWCLFTLVLVFSNVAFGQVELKVDAKNQSEFTEAKPDNRLRIICPTCHRALYVCEVEEFFNTDNPSDDGDAERQAASCRPMIKGLPDSLKSGTSVLCPYDGGAPFRNAGVSSSGYPMCTVYTNRGWQPTRPKPR